MKKIAYCLLLFITNSYVYLAAQAYQPAVPKDKSTFIDSEGKQPSSTAVRVIPRVRENYESTFSRSEADTDRSVCGTMPFFEERHEAQRSCAFYGEADEPEVRDSFIPNGGTPVKTVRLYVHAFVDGNGDTTASLADVEAQMYTLNEEFSSHRVSFEALYDVHYDSDYDSVSSWGYYLKEAYAVNPSEYHNVFITDLDGYLGVSTFPWDTDALNIFGGTLVDRYWFGGPRYFEGEYDIPQRTLTHELGHALGLWHTHHGVDEVAECGSCYEGADGYSYSGDDNRDVVGDLCSDTKSTPTNFSCSDPSGTDCQGNNWVDTDVHNYMGYASDLCYNQNGEGFSAQQSGRMHAWVDEVLGSQLVPQDPPPAIFFSEYGEGSTNNKYFEVYNGTGETVSLDNVVVLGNYNGNPWSETFTFQAGATIDVGGVYVIASSNADTAITELADEIHAYGDPWYITAFNGDDVRALAQISGTDTTIIDIIGTLEGGDPGFGWDVAGVPEATRDHTLIRKSSVESGNPNWFLSAGTDADNSEWFVLDQDNWDGLGFHPSDPIIEVNHSLSFDGVDDYVDIGSSDNYGFENTDEITVTAWFKAVDVPNLYPHIIGAGDDGRTLQLWWSTFNKIEFRVVVGGNISWITTGSTLELGEWYHVAASFSSSSGRRIYINGVLEANDYPTGEIEPINSNIYIGNNPFLFPREFSGPIDEVSLWNKALTQEQINQSMANEIDHFDPNLVGYWKFNEGSGDVVTDHSDNGNNGAINGGATWTEDVPVPPVLGCTDPYSGDYNSDATIDDGTCSDYPYNGDYVLSLNGQDGLNNYVEVQSSNDFIHNGSFTIQTRLKATPDQSYYDTIISAYYGFGYVLYLYDGVLYFQLANSNLNDIILSVSGNTDFRDNQWHDVMVVVDQGNVTMYVSDGSSGFTVDATATYNGEIGGNGSSVFNQSPNIFFGHSPQSSQENFSGYIDHIAIWDRSFSSDELEDEFYNIYGDEDGLAGYWNFKEGNPDIAYDRSGNLNHGTINGDILALFGCMDPYAGNYNPDATVDNGDCSGYPENGNNSLFFNNNSVSIDHNIGDYSSSVTIMAWIKKDGSESYSNIVSGSCGGLLFTEHDNRLLFGSQCGNPIAHDTYSSTVITDNVWHHVAATYDADAGTNNLKVYVDGVLENESTKSASFNIDNLKIGSSPSGDGEYFNGNIDMLRIWDIALSDEQIQENMYNQFPNEDANLLADWRFNDGEGDILFDHSGNSNHGEINGPTWDGEGYQTPTTAVTFSVNMRDYVEEIGDSLDSYGGMYIAGGNIGAENPEDSLFMGHQMYDDDGNNIYEVTLDLERNTHYLYKYRIGSAAEDWNGNWENYLDECGEGYFGDRYFDTGFSDSMSVGPFCWNSCENCILPNRSLSFDGLDDYVDLGDNDIFNLNDFTISIWFKSNWSGGPGDWVYLFGRDNHWGFWLQNSGNLRFSIEQPNGVWGNVESSEIYTDSSWHHASITRDNQTGVFSLYIDGDFIEDNDDVDMGGEYSSADLSGTIICDDNLYIGYHPVGSPGWFNGNVDNIKVYDRILNQEELQLIIQDQSLDNEENLIGYWNFNDGEGETLTDLSPYGNHGTINGATWSNDVRQEPYYGPEWYVSTEGSDDNNGSYDYPFASVQRAIDAANDYDMVEISSGEYFENVVINKNIHIGGNHEDGDITINGDRNGSVFTIDGDNDSISVYMFGLRIIDGRAEKGGGIVANNAWLEMGECIVSNNQTAGQGSQGGGIYAFHSTVILQDCDVENNNTDDLPGLGAGVYSENSPVYLYDNSWVYNNNSSSGSGGGIYGTGPETYMEIHNSYVNNNASNQKGGGLYLKDSSHVYLFESNINNNDAVVQGGGVYLENNSYFSASDNSRVSSNTTTQDCFTGQGSQGGGLYVSQSTVEYYGGYIYGNSSADAGGAMFVTNGSNVNLSYVGMDTNESAEVGGGENTIGGAIGIVYDSEVNIDHCTALLNSSTSGGVGGLYAENSNVNISNSIFWDNPGEWNNESGQLIGSDYNVAYSDIQGGYPGEGNIDADPLFCNTSYYNLAENSPAVGTAQDGDDMGYAGVDCEPIYSANIESVEIFVSGQSAEFNISTDSDYDHFHWIIDYGETFMSNQTTTINDLSVGLHRFAAYLVNANHQPVSIQFVQNFMIQDTVDVYFTENFDELDSMGLGDWGFYTNDHGWEINYQSILWSPTGWRVSQGSGDFAFAQDRNNSDASEDYLVMPEMNLSAFGQPVALEFFSFFTGSRVYPDSLPYGKTGGSNAPYNQANYPNMSEYGGDTVEDPLYIDAIPATLTGTTEGYTDDYNEVCPWDESGAPDVVYAFTPDQDIIVDVSMCSDGNQYDTKIYVYENYVGNLANTVHGTSACNDDFCQNSHTEWASFIDGVVLNAGNTYYFIIDGYWSNSYGDYEMVLLEDEGFVGHTAHVEISTDGGDNWEEIYQLSPSDQNIWEPAYIDLGNYASESGVLIAFHSSDQGEIGTGWAVDDVTILTAYQESEGFIVGSVYSEETGDPMSGVYIEAVSEDSSVYNWAISDSSGYFDMGVTGNKYYFFRASNEYGEYVDYFYVGGNETYDLGEIYIANNTTAFVEGWTSDWYTGQPLGGSSVLFVYYHDGETHTIEESTAPDGYFMVQVPADHDYDMFIFADGYWAEHDAFYLSAGDHHTLGIGIAPLNMASRVYGSVTDANSGDMVHGAEAVLECGDSEDWDHTGALGSYRVFSYYSGDCDDGTLTVRADGYRTQYFPAGEMNLQAGQSFTLNVTLEEGNDPEPAFMLGRVHSSNNGDGISYAQVSAYSYSTGETYGVEADDNGYYYMGDLIGEQEYEVMSSADGYTSLMETHYLGSGDSLYLDFYLDQAPQSGIFGIVENSDGEPLSEVNIYPELNGDEFFWAATDSSGYYHVVLPPGSYFVSTGINDYYVSSVSDIEVVDQEMVEINFTLDPVESFDGGAAGIVYSGVGETASGVSVNFWNTALYDAIVYSDENGAYSIELVNGTYNVSVWGGGFEGAFIPGVTINNNILPLDIYMFDNNSPQPPVIVQLEDVPNDQGSLMDMVWSPGIPQEWEIFPYYSVWRENEDSWHFISMVPFHDFDVYNMVVPTLGDSTHEGIHWSTFMVTAHTEDPYVFFDSEPSSGYSIDNLPPDTPVGLSAEIIEGGVMLNWLAPLDDDFAYHNVYRSDVMSEESAMVFTTVDSFYVDTEVDPGTNYEYWVTAVDHSGNESNGSNTVQISPTGLSTDADLVPDVYALGQNYPNPFNPSTQIRYALPEQSKVVLTVYDMLGRKVRTLVNGVQDAGYRTVMWNATSDVGTPVSAGMYIYTIRADEFYQVKKMILLK